MVETFEPRTLLLTRADVEHLLPPHLCIAAIEDAFRRYGEGRVPPTGILGMHAAEGGFHVKAGFLGAHFAAKLNANFPQNPSRHGLPTIQGVVVLFDASNGAPLAILDSGSITALRTAAATAVAAKYLARSECEALLICGCGGQASAQLDAILDVRKPHRILAYDVDRGKAVAFAKAFSKIPIEPADDLARAARACDLIVTCTTATKYFLTREMIRPGAFIAAIGADSEAKQEIEPALMAHARVVTDLTEQARAIGDLHHAIAAGAMTPEQVHAELGQVVAGRKPGRESAEEILVFDSTGTGLQDVAAAVAAYRSAVERKAGRSIALSARA
jgi:ornithine cyclodeaminase/alanine dehydrogenase-like protein (mu-crystallin family)